MGSIQSILFGENTLIGQLGSIQDEHRERRELRHSDIEENFVDEFWKMNPNLSHIHGERNRMGENSTKIGSNYVEKNKKNITQQNMKYQQGLAFLHKRTMVYEEETEKPNEDYVVAIRPNPYHHPTQEKQKSALTSWLKAFGHHHFLLNSSSSKLENHLQKSRGAKGSKKPDMIIHYALQDENEEHQNIIELKQILPEKGYDADLEYCISKVLMPSMKVNRVTRREFQYLSHFVSWQQWNIADVRLKEQLKELEIQAFLEQLQGKHQSIHIILLGQDTLWENFDGYTDLYNHLSLLGFDVTPCMYDEYDIERYPRLHPKYYHLVIFTHPGSSHTADIPVESQKILRSAIARGEMGVIITEYFGYQTQKLNQLQYLKDIDILNFTRSQFNQRNQYITPGLPPEKGKTPSSSIYEIQHHDILNGMELPVSALFAGGTQMYFREGPPAGVKEEDPENPFLQDREATVLLHNEELGTVLAVSEAPTRLVRFNIAAVVRKDVYYTFLRKFGHLLLKSIWWSVKQPHSRHRNFQHLLKHQLLQDQLTDIVFEFPSSS